MHIGERKQQLMTRRGVMLFGLMVLPFAALVGRLYWLQVVTGQKYRKLSERNRIRMHLIKPARGLILDREGTPLANNVKAYQMKIVGEQVKSPKQTLYKVSRLIELSSKEQIAVIEQMRRTKSFLPVVVKERMQYDEISKVMVNLPDLPGIQVGEEWLRFYPLKSSAAHILGYVGAPTAQQVKKSDDPLLTLPSFKVGRRGLERTLEKELRGVAGKKESEINARGRSIRELNRLDAQDGDDIRLTLHRDIQANLEQHISKYSGAALLMDVETGEILAAANNPSFDPNLFVKGLDSKTWASLRDNLDKPLLNRFAQGLYAPGSTFKMLVALAALEEGLASPNERIRCVGHMQFGNRRFHCWDTHGVMNLNEALRHSCDIYFYELADRLGVDKIAEYAKLLGLGEKTGVPVPEDDGLIPTRAWKERVYKERWNKGENLVTGIGQGFVQTTPLQLLVMTARLATGKKVSPTLVLGPKQEFEDLPFKKEHLDFVRQAMSDVVNHPRGTAYFARLGKFKFAGKTGTAQVVSKRLGKDFDMSTIEKYERPNGLFVAFGPTDKPKYALSVVLEHSGSSSKPAKAAKEIFKDLTKLIEKGVV